MILTGAFASPMIRGLGMRADSNVVSLGVVVVLPGASPQATKQNNSTPNQIGRKRCMLTTLRFAHTNLRGTTDKSTAIITTIGANRPSQVNYMVTADTAPA